MRFAEIVFRSLARRISSMMAEYDASTSGARRSGWCQYSLTREGREGTYPPWLWWWVVARWWIIGNGSSKSCSIGPQALPRITGVGVCGRE